MSLLRKSYYILYKIMNGIFLLLYPKYFIGDIFFSRDRIALQGKSRILFDFSHSSTHLGDRLFFAPLVFRLMDSGHVIALAEEDSITESLFKEFRELCSFDRSYGNDSIDLVVVPSPSALAFIGRHSGRKKLICQITLIKNKCLLREMSQAFSEITQSQLGELSMPNMRKPFEGEQLKRGSKYFLFSNYIDSGWFRTLFLNTDCMRRQARGLRELGYNIIHVGSKRDLHTDSRQYDFVDLDFRGVLSVPELVRLVNADEIIGAVTYDNFLMHLTGISDKDAFVLFRGRFSSKSRDMHFNFINPAFFSNDNKIKYLK